MDLSRDDIMQKYRLRGTPNQGLISAALGLFAGLTSIVFYGVAGPQLQAALGLSASSLGLLLSSPHISKALLRIPFGAWVDEVGGRRPFLWLLLLSCIGFIGTTAIFVVYYPDGFGPHLLLPLILFGVLAGAGAATFSVGIPKTSYWFSAERQGYALGFFAGIGNIGPGVFNLLIPVWIGVWGLAGAYVGWSAFMVLATVVYALAGVDAYSFQLQRQGLGVDRSNEVAGQLGQEVFPSGRGWQSLSQSARNGRTWILVFLYTISFGGGFTAMAAWFPTYWQSFHGLGIVQAGALAAAFTIYGSLIRVPGGSLSDRFGGEPVAMLSFAVMAVGAAVLMAAEAVPTTVLGMTILGTGMGIANAAVFQLVPKYVPEAIGGASGWIGGIGGLGTLLILPAFGMFVDAMGQIGYARGFAVLLILSGICAAISAILNKRSVRKNSD